MATKTIVTKNLTGENWLQPDTEGLSAMKDFEEDRNGMISADDWLALCRTAELSLKVPRNVRAHFEAARGALAYGYFYYPLYTLAIEQLFRTAEWAILQKCKETNGRIIDHKGRLIDFYQGLAWLRKINFLSKEEFHHWESMLKFRRRAANPKDHKDPEILPPDVIANHLNFVAEKINSIFY